MPIIDGRDVSLPGNPRYKQPLLYPIWGYDNLYYWVGRVEIATLLTMAEIGIIPAGEIALLTEDVITAVLAIKTTDVDAVEKQTRHDILAWKELARQIVPTPLNRWLHIPLTSYDPLGTGHILQFMAAQKTVIRPLTARICLDMCTLIRQNAEMLQIGRTHGQHGLPITVGFWLATILNRWLYNGMKMEAAASELVGKISGAVGAYNAQVGLGILERCGDEPFEIRVLEKLGITPGPISTQILPPEPLANYLFAAVLQSSALGQFGCDCRQLARPEIGELCSFQGSTSSTMAHKTLNPVKFENLEGTWERNRAEVGKVLAIQISEHQRDLVGSSIYRDLPIVVINLVQQLTTLTDKRDDQSFLSRLGFSAEACRRNFEFSANVITAEPMYIALEMAGYEGDAHALVNRRLVPESIAFGKPLVDILEAAGWDDASVGDAVARIPPPQIEQLKHPEKYIGLSIELAHQVADDAEAVAKGWLSE